MATSESCYLSHFLICHQPPFLIATFQTLQDIALGGSGRKWYTATLLVCFSFFLSFFFLASFLFCSQVTTLYHILLANRHGWLLPQGPIRAHYQPWWWQWCMMILTYPHLTLYHTCMCHVAVLLVGLHHHMHQSLSPSWLHAPHHHAPCGRMHHITIFALAYCYC